MTLLQFSSDHLELIGTDLEILKKKLKIKALERRETINASVRTTIRPRRISDPAGGFSQQWNIWETTYSVDYRKWYADPETGEEG